MKKPLLYSLLACSLFAGNVISQTTPVAKKRTCGAHSLPAEFETWLQSVQHQQSAAKSAAVHFTIPVVVHIIHNGEAVGTGLNISDAQVISQIEALNRDYNKLNADTTIIPAVWKSVAANCEITFCLAKVDPTGAVMPSPGIDRVNRNTKGFTAGPYTEDYNDNTVKPKTIWNTNDYLNMWCEDLGDDLYGYATFPNPSGTTVTGLSAPYGTATTDGVVIAYKTFGTIGDLDSRFAEGGIVTHETGHWLGLRHIWGDSNCGNDYCNDTPPAKADNNGCFTFPYHKNTCTGNATNGEMFMNYMDYSDDPCIAMFTNDQKARMQAILSGSAMRKKQATSIKCNLPTAISTESIANAIAVYPNPSTDLLYISLPTGLDVHAINITLVDALGRIVKSEVVQNKQELSIDLNALSQGVYHLQISNASGILKHTSVIKN